jgi:hypothetical protein
LSYQLVIECINYYGTPSPERMDFVKRHLKESLGNADVRMFELEISSNLIMPQILIHYNVDENPESFIRNVDSILASIGLTTFRAVLFRVTTLAAEGAATGGLTGAAAGLSTSKKDDVLLFGMIGSLLGTTIGSLIKKGTPVVSALKVSGDWSFYSVE